MSWNYRVIKMPCEETYYEIKEVYYDEDNNINGYADAPVPYGETPEEVKEVLKLMLRACDEPILDYDDIKGGRL